MADDPSRMRRLVELFHRLQRLAESEREELLEKTRAEDAELAASLVELLGREGPVPSNPTPVIEWIRERYGAEASSRVTLETPAEPGAKVDSEIVRRLVQRGDAYGRYRLEGEIGHGGQGAVLRAWDLDLRRRLAMKVMLREGESGHGGEEGSRKLSRFLEEAQVTGQLEHPGIVPVHELGLDHEGRVYFTMQLVKGRDLRRIIELVNAGEEGWTLTRALGVFIKVCETVAFAHSKGVIHRDLKPSNVMVGKFGEVYVMDWGLARVQGREDPHDLRPRIDDDSRSSLVETERQKEKEGTPDSPLETMDGAVLGTPAYMAVEQAHGLIEIVDRRSDVYSVGAMLYHLLAGHSPYVPSGARMSPRTVHAMVLRGPPPPLAEVDAGIPAELAAICEKAMARDRDRRYADTMEMAADIEAYLGRRPVAAVAPRLRYVLKLAFERNRTLATTVTAAAVILVVLVAVFIANLESAVRETNAALNENERLVDELSAPALIEEFEELFPLLPETAPRLRSWLERTDALLARRSAHRLASDGGDELPAQLDVLERLRPRAAANLDTAENLRRDTIEAHAEDWEEAIADVARLEVYGGLALAPQLGLVPLGRNERSGLWEFWHVLSGERPELDSDLGEPVVREETGVVLVLVPGGSFSMGSPAAEIGRQPNERLHRVTLAPYFLAKHEVTQAQWLRVMGENPSGSLAGHSPVGIYVEGPGQEITPVHPVENVSWHECREFVRRLALELPTEARWEHACRAGTTTAFSWGDELEVLEWNENVLDQDFASRIGLPTSASWDDGFWHHAPVGSFAPNGFGLFDMHGNVAEWCLDVDLQEYPADSDEPGDGLHEGGDPRRRTFRGGSWYLRPEFCRCAFRHFDFPRSANFSRGLRVARSVTSG